ncbi:hypothetical protein M422DRAFT_33818 [Sphaerobolus stellatus SS14]|uniref:E3 ubiquitin-protein ligase listerin n=1 Tax=Sphaerobolus stellatus (strain SS14) TaxID=990650 RepID=A0A0C9VIB7_SPHS4|nr:hypothetical protein M422DRAFT_33818 [Sphaerobolus stellatus SS14]
MPKNSKSSASSATRKKHAKKVTPGNEVASTSQQPTKTKPSKKQIKKGLAPPPKKQYIAPSKLKPAPPQVDPLDGLGPLLPPDLVLILRKLAKKDTVTKGRALEELEAWIKVAKAESNDPESGLVEALVIMLPVWFHRFPALCVHPSRRLRQLSAALQTLLLSIPDVRRSIILFQRETGSESDISHVLGAWCLSAWDVDRSVSHRASRSWTEVISVQESNGTPDNEHIILDDKALVTYVIPFITTTIMDPSAAYTALVPPISGDSAASSQYATPTSKKGGPPPSIRKALERDLAVPSRAEEDPEPLEDRNARLRMSALGALRWIFDACTPTPILLSAVHSLLSSPLFWSILHHSPHPPFLSSSSDEDIDPLFRVVDTTEGLGTGQPIVRRAAWALVNALVSARTGTNVDRLGAWLKLSDSEDDDSALKIMATAVLRSAFVESDITVRGSMWEALLLFLTKVKNAWLLSKESARSHTKQDEVEEEDEDDSDEESEPDAEKDHGAEEDTAMEPYPAYTEFLAFLALGCNGSPVQGYPTVLVILSTLPRKILSLTLPSLTAFFDALWSAIDGQALSTLSSERAKATEAFLAAWSECLVWVAGRLVKGSKTADEGADVAVEGQGEFKELAKNLVDTQFKKLVDEFDRGVKIEAGVRVAGAVRSLEGIHIELLNEAWQHISSYITSAVFPSADEPVTRSTHALSFVSTLNRELQANGEAKTRLENLICEIGRAIVKKMRDSDSGDGAEVLQALLDRFGDLLQKDTEFSELLSGYINNSLPILLIGSQSLVLSYLRLTQSLPTWHNVLSTLSSSLALPIEKRMSILRSLLAHSQDLNGWATPKGRELQALVEQAVDEAVMGDDQVAQDVMMLLKNPDPFISLEAAYDLIANIVSTVDFHIQPLLRSVTSSAPESLTILRASFNLLVELADRLPMELPQKIQSETLPNLFVLGFVLPLAEEDMEDAEKKVATLAMKLWEVYPGKKDVDEVKKKLKELVTETYTRVSPVAILLSLSHLGPSTSALDILPTPEEFRALLNATSTNPLDPTLAVIEPLVPSAPVDVDRSAWNTRFDSTGYSPYARAATGLLHVLTTDRQLARANLWALQYVLTLALFASEAIQVPNAENPVFSKVTRTMEQSLKQITRNVQKVAAFLLSSAGNADAWHKNIVTALSARGKGLAVQLDGVGEFIRTVFEWAKEGDSVRDSLVLHTVLQHVLPNTSKEEADGWIELAREIEGSAHQTSLAVALAVAEFAPEPPRLDRYRNELASKISGVSASKANSAGYRFLRSLNAIAPDPESDVIFMPQQRAVFLVQALQGWMGSDEDIDEGVEVEVTKVLADIAPILLGLQGAHWEFIMDLVESNIENCSFKDLDTLVLLSRTLRLVSVIMDLAKTNKYLRELWGDRSKNVLTLVRDLVATPAPRSTSIPRSICREQALSIIEGLPGTLMDENTLSTMCHLLTDSSVENQKMAYNMLQQAAFRRTEHLVIEAGVDTEDTLTIELPKELLVILQDLVSNEETEGQDPLAYLLAWLLTFDLFIDASLKVKTAYVEQLRNLDLIGTYFLPNVFDILGVGNRDGPFKLDAWGIDEYWLPMYDDDAPQSLSLLAAHVYYRALLTVPSLVRTWWEGLKDRQLSTAISTFTSSYFSPVLIASEFSQIKPTADTAAGSEPLSDDTFSVKVATAVNEVLATFNVDEQQMEIGVKLPAGYPLRGVEVRPIKKVGVTEKVWRRWLFAVQQVITAHNGRIVDGLTLFKKTVSLHFEGQVECAICYSILHVVDQKLPTKPCKTCKNRFHAGCLFKWFNTSHSSSCPLCRSDIM